MKRFSFSIHSLAFVIVFAFLLASCEKEVHINLAGSPPKVVVNGSIETGFPPYIFFTSTIGFFSTVDLATLQNSFLHGATMTVSDGSTTVTLKEYSLDTGVNRISFYSVDTANLGNLMLGQVGKMYTLTILYNGTTYTAVTKIPNPKGIDTLWFDVPVFQNSKTPDSAKQLFANYTDPDTPGNYVRYFTRRNHESFYQSGIFSDEVVNGKRISNIGLYAGYDNTNNANGDSLRYFYPGDSVVVKWCEIDKGVYTFWNTYDYANNALGNPFASPINVTSNVSNGALGVWAGYGSIYYTIALPK